MGGAGKTLLLVDDEASIGMGEAKVLRAAGYEVMLASTREGAIEAARTERGRVDLVLMDMDFGQGMDGIRSAAEILERRDLPILFLSSGAEGEADGPALLSSVEAALDLWEASGRRGGSRPFAGASSGRAPGPLSLVSIPEGMVVFSEPRAGEPPAPAAGEGQEDYRVLVDHIQSLVCKVDSAGRYLFLSPSYKSVLGYEPKDLLGKPAKELLHPDDMRQAVGKFTAMQKPGMATVDAWRFRHANGSWRWFECRTAVYLGRRGLLETIVVSSDITARKQIEDAQSFLAQRGWAKSGEDFFRTLARFLAEQLTADYVCIDGFPEGSAIPRTAALYLDGRFEEDESFALRDMLCDEVVEKSACCFPEGVCRLFPEDEALRDIGADGYAGMTLASSEGKVIGMIAVVKRSRFEDPAFVRTILQLVAGRAAGELERREGVEALRRSLAQTETLMKELQHRVKNNLNIVSSLLSLESEGLKDEASRSVFLDAQSRILSMSAIYERLYLSSDLAQVQMDQYLRDLAASIFVTYTVDSARIRLRLSLQPLALETKRAIPLGLIVNELITNAIKYAYPDGASGEVAISLECSSDRALLCVRDDGAGLPAGLDPKKSDGMGLTLVRSLASQMDAALAIESSPGSGMRARIEFAR
jgi:PAS domain S-box-containing protein